MRRLSVLLACVVMALTLVAISLAPGAAVAQPPGHFYGATYYSPTQDQVYGGTGPTLSSAIQATSNRCQQDANDCAPQLWVYNGWIAFVSGDRAVWFSAGRTEQQALAGALTNCQTNDTNCTRGGTLDTWFDPNEPTRSGRI
jgi:hypothetical protein